MLSLTHPPHANAHSLSGNVSLVGSTGVSHAYPLLRPALQAAYDKIAGKWVAWAQSTLIGPSYNTSAGSRIPLIAPMANYWNP